MNAKLTEAQKKALNTVSTVFQTAYLLGDVHPSALAALARKGLVERKWSEGSLRGDGRWSYRLSGRGVVALRKIEREHLSAEAARAAVIGDQITAVQEASTETRYEVECQEDCNDGTVHEATYSHDDPYSGKRVYTTVCNGYEDSYTEDVVRAVKRPEVPNLDNIGEINEGNNMTDQLNISNRVQWSEIVDEGPAITREGEVFQFLSGGYVQVTFKEGTEHRSKTMHRDRLTKV